MEEPSLPCSETSPRSPSSSSATSFSSSCSSSSSSPSSGTSAVPSLSAAAESSDTKLSDDDCVILPAKPSDPRYETFRVDVRVTKEEAKYSLRPTHCGPKVVFLNAENPAFYERRLPNPKYTCWILCRMAASESHALKRLWETGWRKNIQMQIMEESKFELIASKDGLEEILYEGKKVVLPDCVITRVGANVGYFGLAVIRHLENLGVLIFNGLRGIEISRDKLLTLQYLAAHGLPIPKTILAKFPVNLATLRREFTYPIVVKRASGSQGVGVIKVDTHEQMEDLVNMLDTGKPLIFQEYVSASAGKDLRVFVIGGRVVGAMMRVAAKGNFKANVHQGGSVRKVQLSSACEWLVLETVRIIGLDVAGVDLLIDDNTYKICEVNSSPGFAGLEVALGFDIAARMFQYMKMRLGAGGKGDAPRIRRRIEVSVPVQRSHIEPADTASQKEAKGPTAPIRVVTVERTRVARTTVPSVPPSPPPLVTTVDDDHGAEGSPPSSP